KIMLSVTTFADEMKRVKDGQTVYDKVSAKARQGHVVGSSVFGYDNVPVSGPSGKRSHVSRVINPAQAGIVRRILELSETGMGLTRIAKLLNADGAPAPKPKRGRDPGWSASTVREILNRRLYLGEVVWGRTKKRDKHGRLKLSRRPPEEWIRTKDETLRIVSDEQWSRTHNRLARVREQMRAMGGGARKLRTRDVDDIPCAKLSRAATHSPHLFSYSGETVVSSGPLLIAHNPERLILSANPLFGWATAKLQPAMLVALLGSAPDHLAEIQASIQNLAHG